MKSLLIQLYNDEAGFIVSAELVLIGTIAILSMVVGLSELSLAVNHELRDCARAFESFHQNDRYDDDDNDWDDWDDDWEIVSR